MSPKPSCQHGARELGGSSESLVLSNRSGIFPRFMSKLALQSRLHPSRLSIISIAVFGSFWAYCQCCY